MVYRKGAKGEKHPRRLTKGVGERNMTIKEVEERTGLTRSNIRFYEKEGLIQPRRNEQNGYRAYSEADVTALGRIAYLRTLGVSIEAIRSLIEGKAQLRDVLTAQETALRAQIDELKGARQLCAQMLMQKELSFETLDTARYVARPHEYWRLHRPALRLDSASFISLWGSLAVWAALTLLGLLLAAFSYGGLPEKIPVQWSGGEVSSWVPRMLIFAYPAFCVLARLVLRPFIREKLGRGWMHTPIVTEYLTNFLCFVLLSVEAFTLLYLAGAAGDVRILLFVDAAAGFGVLALGLKRMDGYTHL